MTETTTFTFRPIDPRFIEAMEAGLAKGRALGRTGWDTKWEDLNYHATFGELFTRLVEEYHELMDALQAGEEPQVVIREAADVANLAMMLWDLEDVHNEVPPV